MNQPKYLVTLIGAGQLGSRYLQGMASVTVPLEIWVVDPSRKALDIASNRWNQVHGSQGIHRVNFSQKLSDVPQNVDVAVVATSANVRLEVIDQLLKDRVVRYFVLEKLIAQSSNQVESTNASLKYCEGAWVNHARRMMSWHKAIGSELGRNPILDVQVTGHDWGLATNAMHFMDLVQWWSGTTVESLDTSGLDRVWFESKRPGFYEINGEIICTYKNGSRITLRSCGDDSKQCNHRKLKYVLKSKAQTWIIEEDAGKATRDNPPLLIPGSLELQSVITKDLITSILEMGTCELPTLSSCLESHGAFLDAMLVHWRATRSPKDSFVGIT